MDHLNHIGDGDLCHLVIILQFIYCFLQNAKECPPCHKKYNLYKEIYNSYKELGAMVSLRLSGLIKRWLLLSLGSNILVNLYYLF